MNIKDLGQLVSLMTKLPSIDKIKEEAERMQQRLAEITAEGDAGAGMVKIRVNGRMEVLQCQISSEALNDKEMLEDLVAAAVNQDAHSRTARSRRERERPLRQPMR